MSNKQLFRNDFLRLHGVFIGFYLLTFLVGLLRENYIFFYKIHPFVGMASFVVPLLVYLASKHKKLIHKMIASNFKSTSNPWLRVARISSIIIIGYYFFSVLTGMILILGLYGSEQIYNILHAIHGVSKILVPIVVASHVVARLKVKASH